MSLVLLMTTVGQAVVVTWTGTTDTDWTNPANWDTNNTPTSTDSAVVDTTLSNIATLTTPGITTLRTYAGSGSGKTGILNISGNGSITSTAETRLGDYGNGTINISGNGSCTSTGAPVIGFYGAGTINISDHGSFTSPTYANVALNSGSTGTINITDNGSFHTSMISISVSATATGTVNVSGNGSLLSNATIGYYGTGTLNLSDNSTYTSTYNTYIGQTNSSHGTLNISDNSSAISTNETYIGYYGTGTANLSGGSLSSLISYLGYDATAGNGTFNIGGTPGNAKAPGTVTGDVLFRAGIGTINFNHTSSNYTFGSTISNTSGQTPNPSSAVNIRAGKTIFTGTKDYTPPTNVLGGELEIQTSLPNSNVTVSSGAILSVTESGTLGGNITNNGTTAFNSSGNNTYTKILSGAGDLTKSGSGTLTLSGDSSGFAGTTTVEAGELKLINAGSKLGGTTTVQSGAKLSGNGSIGDLTIDAGATIAPGNSIGTLSIAGNYSQNGTYDCEVAPVTGAPVAGTDNNLIQATGTANLNGTLNVIPTGSFQAGQSITYTILTSNGGLTGTFSSVTGASPLFSYGASYDANNAYLTLTKASTISQVVNSGNPGSVASYLDCHCPSSPLVQAQNTLNQSQLERSLNDLSPANNSRQVELVPHTQLSNMDSSFTWSSMDRMASSIGSIGVRMASLASFQNNFSQLFGSKRQNQTSRFIVAQGTDPKHLPVSARVQLGKATFWIQGSAGRFSQTNITSPTTLLAQGLDASSYDTNVGLDYALSATLKVGVTTGYSYTQHKMKINGDRGVTNSTRFGVYSVWEPAKNWYVNSTVYYGHHRFRANRVMTVIPAVAHHKNEGDHGSGLIEVGRDFTLPQAVTVTPYVSGAGLYLHENRYAETGATFQNLAVKSRHSTTLQGRTGVQIAKLWDWDDRTKVYSFAKLGVTYRRAVGKYQKTTASLVGQSGSFKVLTRNNNHLMATPSVGTTAFLSHDVYATLVYEGEIGSNQRNHQAMIRFNWAF